MPKFRNVEFCIAKLPYTALRPSETLSQGVMWAAFYMIKLKLTKCDGYDFKIKPLLLVL